MPLLDWTLVVFGVAVALTGSWIQLHPEHVVPSHSGSRQESGQVEDWPLDPAALAQIRLLGACFLFMGAFFTMQMTIDLTRLPWWIGTLSGLAMGVATVSMIHARIRRQQRRRRSAQHSTLAEKAFEVQ